MKYLFNGILFSCVLAAIPAWGQTYRPGQTFTDCTGCPEMVVVPMGRFLMGSTKADRTHRINPRYKLAWISKKERPRHWVAIQRAFAFGRFEVTRGQFAAFERASGYRAGGNCWYYTGENRYPGDGGGIYSKGPKRTWRNPGFPQIADHPVVCVNLKDARAYVSWLTRKTGKRYRLPSEAEWEYSARAGTRSARHWGDDTERLCVYANGADQSYIGRFPHDISVNQKCRDGRVFTAPAGSFAANRFGLFDMLGNVWERVQDCYHESYAGAPTDGRPWTIGGNCRENVIRGGSWSSFPWYLRSAYRAGVGTGERGSDTGFRVARTLP